jgi:chemotaxis protein methyltransferase CheR
VNANPQNTHPQEYQSMSGAFASLAAVLKARSGLALGTDKLYLLETRLAPLLKREGLRDLAALADKLRAGSPLEREVVDAMTTNESLFFRDTKPFVALRERILPRLHTARPPGTPLRVWSAAASTGQEAYSIAMTVAEMAPALAGRPVEILGTDLAREPLERARAGLYSQFEIQRGLPMQTLVRHFAKEDGQWRIKPALRAAVSFREWNLLEDPRPLGRFDIVFCRNVLIYFDAPTKRLVLDRIAALMPPDGVLYLGGAETVFGITERFRSIPGEPGAYAPETPRRAAA